MVMKIDYFMSQRLKEAKYNLRHWHWEQTDSARVGGEGLIGGKGGGFTGTIIEDTRTITRGVETGEGGGQGWGGREGWGKKAENCTWTTIKNV